MQFKKVYIVGGKIVMAKTEIKGRKKKRIIIFVSMALVIVTLITTIGVYGYVNTASNYTVEEHTERISKLAKKRYIDSGKFTGYKVYPLYNEKEEQEFFMVELEPHGFVYIKVYDSHYSCWGGVNMYMIDRRYGYEDDLWRRYTIDESIKEAEFINKYGFKIGFGHAKWETDENGNTIDYTDSPFKIANIQNEKRYLLYTYYSGTGTGGYIPAVKRGDKYLNLMSMEEFDYNDETQRNKQAIMLHGDFGHYEL